MLHFNALIKLCNKYKYRLWLSYGPAHEDEKYFVIVSHWDKPDKRFSCQKETFEELYKATKEYFDEMPVLP